MQPNNLAKEPLQPIAHHGIANTLADRKTKPRPVQAVRPPDENERPASNALALATNTQEVR